MNDTVGQSAEFSTLPVANKGFFTKANRHLLLLLYLPVYGLTFMLLEKHIVSHYWVSYLPVLDDIIPFVDAFVIPYYLWYPYIILTGIYFMYHDVPTFKKYMYSVIAGYSIGLLVCALFPNGQDLRPTTFAADTLFTRMVKAIYSVDTNTNVLPSMHVIGTLVVVSAILHSPKTKSALVQVLFIVCALLICASTVFIKQHSILDLFAGVFVSLLVHFFVYTLPKKRFFHRYTVHE